MYMRQYKVGDQWVDGTELEWRDVYKCAGCEEVIRPDDPSVDLRLTAIRCTTTPQLPQIAIHENGTCFTKAVALIAAQLGIK